MNGFQLGGEYLLTHYGFGETNNLLQIHVDSGKEG
jgi:hypothetical protein